VTCAPPRPPASSSEGSRSCCKAGAPTSGAVTAWLAFAMFCVSAAAQSMKLWMPAMLVAHRADAGGPPGPQGVHGHLRHHMGRGDTLLGPEPAIISIGGQRFPVYSAFRFADGPNALSLLSVAHAPYMMPAPDYGVVLVLAQAYIVEMVGIIVCAYISTWVRRKHMVQWPLLIAAFFTLASLAAAESGAFLLCGPLIGMQLAAQATGFNFLQVFACEHFPTARRAKITALVNFAAQLGNFVIPALGGFVVQRTSAAGALIFFCALYVVGWIVSLRLPLPTGKERPLHDVDEAKGQRDGSSRARKRASYQTI